MDYFRKYLTGPQAGQSASGAETVERLTDRVKSSTLLEDRRDAVRALRSLAKKFRFEVGSLSMEALVEVVKTDRSDSEIMGYALDALQILVTLEEGEEEDGTVEMSRELITKLAEEFIRGGDHVSMLLSVLQEYDYHILLSTVRLLTQLLLVKTREVQEIVLANPMGISRLMDLLVDSREVIRNEDLLLLRELTKGNTNIQKIVAFENAFERLFDIVRDEGCSEGGIIVEDCLLLLLNLVHNNLSNQNFLKEGSFIQRIPSFFELPPNYTTSQPPLDVAATPGWPQQRVANLVLMLKLIRTLVSPNNPPLQTTACQKLMFQCGLLERLCEMLLVVGVPEEVLVACISTVAEVVRGCPKNQEYFASVMAPSNPPRALIVVLLMSMISESQSFKLRTSIFYCFQSFLYRNELGQSQIVQTLLPSSAEVNQLSAGQLLCVGMFSDDVMSTWYCSICLLHTIVCNKAQKEQLLRVQLASSLGNPPSSLIMQATHVLISGAKFQTRVGLLQLLCHWMHDCPHAVTYFLRSSSSVPYLISQVSASEGDEDERIMHGLCALLLGILILYNNNQVQSYHKNDLRQIIEKRIGFEQYSDKLNQVAKHESYSRACKSPHPTYSSPSEALFDFEFTRLFRMLEGEVLKALTANESDQEKREQQENVVEQYKLLIREQDASLNSTRKELNESQEGAEMLQKEVEGARQQIQFLKDQNSLLKVQTDPANKHGQKPCTDPPTLNTSNGISSEAQISSLSGQVQQLSKQLAAKTADASSFKSDYEAANKQIAQLVMNVGSSDNSVNNELVVERNSLTLRINHLETSKGQLEGHNAELESRVVSLHHQLEEVQLTLQKVESEKAQIEVDRMGGEVDGIGGEVDGIGGEVESLRKEQEDLLLLLSDQDATIKRLRLRLKQLGEPVEEDDDDVVDEDGLEEEEEEEEE